MLKRSAELGVSSKASDYSVNTTFFMLLIKSNDFVVLIKNISRIVEQLVLD